MLRGFRCLYGFHDPYGPSSHVFWVDFDPGKVLMEGTQSSSNNKPPSSLNEFCLSSAKSARPSTRHGSGSTRFSCPGHVGRSRSSIG